MDKTNINYNHDWECWFIQSNNPRYVTKLETMEQRGEVKIVGRERNESGIPVEIRAVLNSDQIKIVPSEAIDYD